MPARVITTIPEPDFDEFKTDWGGAQRALRSTPQTGRREAWGFLLAHVAARSHYEH